MIMAVTSCTVKESRVTREDGRSCPELQAARWHPQLLLQSALLSDPALENRGTRGRAQSGPPVSQAPVPLHRLPLSLPAPGTPGLFFITCGTVHGSFVTRAGGGGGVVCHARLVAVWGVVSSAVPEDHPLVLHEAPAASTVEGSPGGLCGGHVTRGFSAERRDDLGRACKVT